MLIYSTSATYYLVQIFALSELQLNKFALSEYLWTFSKIRTKWIRINGPYFWKWNNANPMKIIGQNATASKL